MPPKRKPIELGDQADAVAKLADAEGRSVASMARRLIGEALEARRPLSSGRVPLEWYVKNAAAFLGVPAGHPDAAAMADRAFAMQRGDDGQA